ncbi:MAG: 4Fe-4S ferredoxin, partial [Deltaproteobacteria bacterium]|nr:4Fe-4S ferredoxin [Deltaproteobacteria bacterium]
PRCPPLAYGKGCVTCNEFCPTSPKAVKLAPIPGSDLNGPRIDTDACIGCGACEFVCPLPLPAILVMSANESRHPDNRATLSGLRGGRE